MSRKEVDASGEIIKFPSGGLPWKSYVYDLEKEHSIDPLIKFVLYTDQAKMWRVQGQQNVAMFVLNKTPPTHPQSFFPFISCDSGRKSL